MDKERHRHREADILLKEQQEVETFDPMLKSTQTASIDYALSYAGSGAGEASSSSDVTEASSNTIQTTDSPALKILKALEQRLKVEIIKFQGQEYYKLIGDLYLQPDAAVSNYVIIYETVSDLLCALMVSRHKKCCSNRDSPRLKMSMLLSRL